MTTAFVTTFGTLSVLIFNVNLSVMLGDNSKARVSSDFTDIYDYFTEIIVASTNIIMITVAYQR